MRGSENGPKLHCLHVLILLATVKYSFFFLHAESSSSLNDLSVRDCDWMIMINNFKEEISLIFMTRINGV